jgi:DNA-binding NarL/FixJ family response regulator
MPVMNGYEAARRIKHELPATLILMVSQFDSAPFQREAIADRGKRIRREE